MFLRNWNGGQRAKQRLFSHDPYSEGLPPVRVSVLETVKWGVKEESGQALTPELVKDQHRNRAGTQETECQV